MHVDEVIAKIGEHMEKLLEEDQDAFGWDIENKVIKDVVEWEKLEKVFTKKESIRCIGMNFLMKDIISMKQREML